MQISKWEGTKEETLVVYERKMHCVRYKLVSKKYGPKFEVRQTETQAIANEKLFTDALHTMQELHLFPSELALGFPAAHKELSEWKQNKIDELNQLREENAKLKEALNAANEYIEESPCDPDITIAQSKAWEKWLNKSKGLL